MKTKKAWFYDIANNLRVAFREYEPGQFNNGDYHHHNWVGPYKTFTGAKREGMKLLRAELWMAQNRLREFSAQQDPTKNDKAK